MKRSAVRFGLHSACFACECCSPSAQWHDHMRAVQSSGSLPVSRGSTPANGVRLGVVKEAPRRQPNNWVQVEEFPSRDTPPPADNPVNLGPRPSTSGSVSRGGTTTVARLPVPGSRPLSQQTTRPATPYANTLLVGMDALTLSGYDDGMDPSLTTSLPSIPTSGTSPYDENQRLRRELSMMRKRYRQLDFELKKELQVRTTHAHMPKRASTI